MNSPPLSYFFNLCEGLKPAYRRFEAALFAVKKRKNQKHFLTKCFEEQVCPKTFGFHKLGNSLGSSFPDYVKSFLKDRIKICAIECESAFFNLRRASVNLKFICPDNIVYNSVTHFAFRKSDYISASHVQKLGQKLRRLCDNSVWEQYSLSENVVNLSNYILDKTETDLLGLGLNFALNPVKKHALDYIVNFDKFLARHNYNQDVLCLKGFLLQGIADCLQDKCGLPHRFQLALTKLKKNNDIIITKSDKGGKVVVLNKADYLDKASDLLSDEATYEKLTKNPLNNASTEFNKKVRNIAKNKKDIKFLEKFKVFNPSLPYFYGLPKIHKENVPLRPIISNIGSYSCKLSKWLTGLLTPFLGRFSNSHILHSEDFIGKIRALNFHNVKMLSLDVVSLFTNVPVEDVLLFLENKLSDFQDQLPLPVSKIIALVRLCVSTNYFSFQNEFYRQKFGCAMGGNLSPVLANLYMEYFESVLLPQIKPVDMIWHRYVDDIFSIWDDSWGSFDTFFQKLNSLVPSIKFKVEWEIEGKLPFLDVLVIKGSNVLDFSVYRKPTHSGGYLHFFSNHPDKIKKSVASGLFLRAYRICSPSYLDHEINVIKCNLNKLGYPEWFLCKALNSARSNYFNSKPPVTRNNCNQIPLKLPFNSYTSSLLANLKLDDDNVTKVTFNYPNSIGRNLVNVYQRLVQNDKPGVYKIPCKDCNDVYIGQTGRNLATRIVEHKRSVRYGQDNSAIFQHVQNQGHVIDWNNSSIIYKSNCNFGRKIVESSFINSTPNFNLSVGQWTPDLILGTVIKRIIPDLTSSQVVGHVT